VTFFALLKIYFPSNAITHKKNVNKKNILGKIVCENKLLPSIKLLATTLYQPWMLHRDDLNNGTF